MHEINIRTYLMYKINSINMGIDDFTIRNFRNFMFNDVNSSRKVFYVCVYTTCIYYYEI